METDSSPKSNKDIWKMTLSQLQIDLSDMAYRTWFSSSTLLSIDGNIAKIGLGSSYIKEYVENHYRAVVINAIRKATGKQDLEPIFEIHTQQANTEEYDDPVFSNLGGQGGSEPAKSNTQPTSDTSKTVTTQYVENTSADNMDFEKIVYDSGLNPRYTFDTYVIGTNNQLVHAAALAVADNPGFAYNPLFIYGDVGLGKTHIMQAIGIEILRKSPSKRVLYVPGEMFLNEMVESIRMRKTMEFREKYRNIDVLIVDDIQVISGKEGTQDELFHTYNVLYQSNKQIVFAADRPPKEIQNLTDRLRSRFEGGMVADIQTPDFETKMAILRQKADDKNLYLPDHFMTMIADMADSNIRELEGALTKIGTFYYLNKQDLTENDIKAALQKEFEKKREKVDPKQVITQTAAFFEISPADIKGKRRTATVALARQVAMYFYREELGMTLEEAAKRVNRKDHTTVIHAVEKVKETQELDPDFKRKVSDIKRAVLKGAFEDKK